MKLKSLLLIAIMTISMSFAQTSKAEIAHIVKEQSDGIPGQKPYQNAVSKVYTDGKDAVKTVYTDVKSLSPKVSQAVESLAEQLKTTTNALWDILVKQQLVWSIAFLILTLASILNWSLFYKRNLNIKATEDQFVKGKKTLKTHIDNTKYDRHGYGDASKTMLTLDNGEEDILIPLQNPNTSWFKYLHLIICISLSLLSIYHFSDMLTGFINPEYGALKTIVQVATQIK